eukprot:7397523-Prorocentrum_lima.AAC.1
MPPWRQRWDRHTLGIFGCAGMGASHSVLAGKIGVASAFREIAGPCQVVYEEAQAVRRRMK